MTVYLIKNEDNIGYYVDNLIGIENLFDGAEESETYSITNVEMSEEEFENLPEFEGF